MRTITRRKCLLLLLLFLTTASLGLAWYCLCVRALDSSLRRNRFKRPGSIHILGTEEEIWLFIEINWMERSSNFMQGRRIINTNREQFAVRYDGQSCRCFPLNSSDLPSFNTNISRIIVSQQTFYIVTEITGPSKSSVYKWQANSFVPMSPHEARALKRRIGYDNTSVLGNEEVLDRETNLSGWSVLYRSYEPFPLWKDPLCDYSHPNIASPRFHWGNNNYVILGNNQKPTFTISIAQSGKDELKPLELLAIDDFPH